MNVKELLYKCQADKTAVLATNFYNFETLTCIMKAAAKMEAPVLLQLTRSSIDYMGLEQAVKMGRQAIANGIVKVNLATEIKDNFMRALKGVLTSSDEIDLRKVFPKAIDPVVDLLCEKYRMVGSASNK